MANAARLARMAWRNLVRHRRRSLITGSSIALGAMLAALMTGLQSGNWREMIDLAARMGGGHVALQHAEYLDTPTLSRSLRGVDELRAIALQDPDVERAVLRITGQIMLSTASQTYGAAVIAYDPESEDATTLSLLEAVQDGNAFTSSSDRGIILGHRLAENLDTGIGRKVVYTLTDKHGEIVRDVARVSGILQSGAPSVDAGLCLLPLDTLRDALGYESDEIIRVGLFLSDQRQADNVVARLGKQVDDPVTALAWHQVQPDLAGFIAMKVAGAQLMGIVMLFLVAAGIFNTMLVSVMERRREFGILLAIGYNPGSIFGLVMLEALWLGLAGLVAAFLLTLGPYLYLSSAGIDIAASIGMENAEVAGVAVPTIMRVVLYPEYAVALAGVILAATLASGLYPAWQAGRIQPVESIRLV